MDCNKRQGIEPEFGQLGSVPATIDPPPSFVNTTAHTLLVSRELCHVALPPRDTGLGAFSLGFASMLRKWVMIWKGCPKISVNRVASGRAGLTVQELPLGLGRQT
jgi:hypothetical protein